MKNLRKYFEEIENAKIREKEFEDLTAEKKEMAQFEKINEALKIYKRLYP